MLRVLELVLLSLIISFFISVSSIPVIIRVAHLKNLTDSPDANRKLHLSSIPTLGGIAIFAGLLVSFSALYDFHGFSDLRFITPALVILFLAGVKDDLLVLDPIKKLLIQILCALIITYFGDLRISSLWGILEVQEVTFWPGVLLTVFLIVALINAFNLIDGINGLAGSLGLLASLSFGTWFAWNGFSSLTILAFSLSGALVGFLLFNYNRAKIFMGDTGSMALGFIVAILAIRFIEANRLQVSSLEYPIINAPAVAFAILSIPVFDMARVFTLRILQRKSPFAADRNHIHHYFVDSGLSHAKSTVILFVINLSCIAVALPLNQFRSAWSVLILVIYLTALIFIGCKMLKVFKTRVQRLKACHEPSC